MGTQFSLVLSATNMFRLLVAVSFISACLARPQPQQDAGGVVFLVLKQGGLSPITPSAKQIESLLTNLKTTSAPTVATTATEAAVAAAAPAEVAAPEVAALAKEAAPVVPVADPTANLVD